MLFAVLEKFKWFMIVSILAIATLFMACQEASAPVNARVEDTSAKDQGKTGLDVVNGGPSGECEGFDILRTPLRMDVEAMPCARLCSGREEPVCTAEGLSYPNDCYAKMAKAEIVSQGVCK
jgi:hypothetical protein